MCEIPNNLLLFDGAAISSNDLTQLTLGDDRDSATVADSFYEEYPAKLKMLRLAVQGARRKGGHSGMCGRVPSDHIEIAPDLVAPGIDSISLTPDRVLRARQGRSG